MIQMAGYQRQGRLAEVHLVTDNPSEADKATRKLIGQGALKVRVQPDKDKFCLTAFFLPEAA